MMIRETFPVGALQCNCTILGDADSKEAIVIDPGDEVDNILRRLARHDFKVMAIVHTHAHIDHIGGAAELARLTGADTHLHPDDQFLHDILDDQARLLGMTLQSTSPIDNELADEGAVCFGGYELGVLHTPGHTPGSVCFELVGHDVCFSGDTLFQGGIGRTDLWGGDHGAIEASIRNRLYTLNGSVEVVPGHGPLTSIDRERLSNPFVRPRV